MLVSSRGASAVADVELHTQTGSGKVEVEKILLGFLVDELL